MKQLLIVNSAKALNAGISSGKDISGLQEGALTFLDPNTDAILAAKPTANFAIALGRANGQLPFMISEVDVKSLVVTKATPVTGVAMKRTFTMPTITAGKEMGVILVKKGTVPNERNIFTTSIVAGSTTAATEATALVKYINNKANDLFNVKATVSGAAITIAAQDGNDYEIKFADALTGTTTSALTQGKKAIGDKAYIADLAQRCAAGKGFNLLDQESRDIYPGFPEAVEDLVPNSSGTGGVSTAGYAIYSLHFATGRAAGKQVDERVWQYVHIAVPITASSYATIDTILGDAKSDDQAEKD